MSYLRTTVLAAGLVLAGVAGAQAQLQNTPVQSPQDQACRDEATRRVFGEPNPGNVDPYVRGRQYWNACMARAKAGGGKAKKARRRRG